MSTWTHSTENCDFQQSYSWKGDCKSVERGRRGKTGTNQEIQQRPGWRLECGEVERLRIGREKLILSSPLCNIKRSFSNHSFNNHGVVLEDGARHC